MSVEWTPEQMAEFVEAQGIMVEAAAGYKAQLVKAGFDEHVADMMTVDWHREFVNKIFYDAKNAS